MRNYLVLISLFLILTNSSFSIQLKEIDFYVYYVQSKNIVVCSDKKDGKEGPILNEIENDKGFTCLLNLQRKQPYYEIILHLSYDEETKISKNFGMDIDLGNVHLFKISNNLPTTKRFFIKFDFETNKIYYLLSDSCNLESIDKCTFREAQNSLFMDKYLQINFETKAKDLSLNFIEKSRLKSEKEVEECDPACEYGVCIEGDCLCKQGYMGANCSVKIESKDFRVGMGLLILMLLGAIIVGALLMLFFWWIYKCIAKVDDTADLSKDVNIMEQWEQKGKTEN